jgi:uncharacterized protein YneF (UPF0154 family)
MDHGLKLYCLVMAVLLLLWVVVIVFLLWIIPEKQNEETFKKNPNIHNFKNNFMKILYKALPILLISAD